MKEHSSLMNRRDFMGAAAAAMAFTIVPSYVLGVNSKTPPSDKLNAAGIGVGGKGAGDIRALGDSNIVAMCDVDLERASWSFGEFKKAKKYTDFRRMLEKEGKNIDIVTISTPDHTHAVAAMACMEMGKHVYVQKPLSHDVFEARKLTEAARKYKVATQMGNQGHSGEGIRLVKEWIADGAIGKVTKVHCWTNRPVWPQGMTKRPSRTPVVPNTLSWDLWLGTAPYRLYHPDYMPGRWRGWWDFGTGVMGDMGCHIFDPVFWGLDLGHPTSIDAEASGNSDESAPKSSKVTYQFPARGDMPAVEVIWYDGGNMPPRPEELEKGRRMGDSDGGCLFEGDKGKIMCGCYGKGVRIIPETKMKEYKRPPKTIARSKGHYVDWLEACKGGKPASSNFDYAGPLTEIVLLANVALRAGEKIEWDGPNMRVTNVAEANAYVRRLYRGGWSL